MYCAILLKHSSRNVVDEIIGHQNFYQIVQFQTGLSWFLYEGSKY